MFRLRILFAALLLAAIAGTVPAMAVDCVVTPTNVGTVTVRTMIAGSSAMWQTMALGAYNAGHSIVNNSATHHFVSNGKDFNLVDTRPTVVGGSSATSTDRAWIVWDGIVSGTKCNTNIWAYEKADSVIGVRSIFGSIGSNVTKGSYVEASTFTDDGGSQIPTVLFGGTAGEVPPSPITALFSSANEGVLGAKNLVNVGATDVDPADGFYAGARVNSVGDTANGYQGLGYGSNAVNSPPACSGTTPPPLANLVGTAILGNNPSDPAAGFPVLAFNLTGQDPFTCRNIPAFSTIPVGAAPIMVVYSNLTGTQLKGLTNATATEIGRVFAGFGNGASAFSGCSTCAGGFVAYLREPLSGTYNTFEETVARHPSNLAVSRYSQETGNVSGGTVAHNPLSGLTADGYRYRAIGTGDEVDSVFRSTTLHSAQDGIGYTFFSFGNVSQIAASTSYSYITINGSDPLWHNYIPGAAGISDPAQPTVAGQLPKVNSNMPAGCNHALPCAEKDMWQADNYAQVNGATWASYSFPNIRNGSYPSWSLLRLVTTSTNQSNAQALVNAHAKFVVTTVPDYIPFNPVFDTDGVTVLDPGLQVLRSHFGCDAQTCGTNGFTGLPNDPSQGAVELGRDAGGAILSFLDSTTGLTQDGFGIVDFQ